MSYVKRFQKYEYILVVKIVAIRSVGRRDMHSSCYCMDDSFYTFFHDPPHVAFGIFIEEQSVRAATSIWIKLGQ